MIALVYEEGSNYKLLLFTALLLLTMLTTQGIEKWNPEWVEFV
jgi:hypothetical protein